MAGLSLWLRNGQQVGRMRDDATMIAWPCSKRSVDAKGLHF